MGLFKPEWMNDDQNKALAAVGKTTSQVTLMRVALKAKSRAVGLAAVIKLTDRQKLAKLAVESDDYQVKETACAKLGGHKWVAIDDKCNYRCSICDEKKTMHKVIRQSPCVALCEECGEKIEEHRWNTVIEQVPTTMRDRKTGMIIYSSVYKQGCTCERCGELNPKGVHEFAIFHEPEYVVFKCKHCGLVKSRMTYEEADRKRYENDVNADEGIFK